MCHYELEKKDHYQEVFLSFYPLKNSELQVSCTAVIVAGYSGPVKYNNTPLSGFTIPDYYIHVEQSHKGGYQLDKSNQSFYDVSMSHFI